MPGVAVGGVLGRLEAHVDVALGGQVVDFVGPDLLNQPDQVGGVGQVAIVEEEPRIGFVRVLVDVVDTLGIEGRGSTLDAVDLITLAQQQLREKRPVLAGHPGNQRHTVHHTPPYAWRGSRSTRPYASSNRTISSSPR